jgi:membrane protease YdiL (CAAX protease family)
MTVSTTATGADAAAGPSHRRVWPATVAVLLVGLAFNLAEHRLGLPVWVGPAMALGLLGFARLVGLSWSQLGLGRSRLLSGLRWGGAAVLAVALVYAVGLMLPLTRTAFLDARYHLSVPSALFTALVAIPVGTVLVEEVLFRSVLWGFLARHTAAWRVLLASSVLFGLWHVLPSIGLASANQAIGSAVTGFGPAAAFLVVAGTVLFTAAGGVVAGELRRRSGSILASAGMHWATNALGILFGLAAWQLVA